MVWFVCKMHLWHMCTFASENLTVKGLTFSTMDIAIPKPLYPKINSEQSVIQAQTPSC